MLNENDVVRLKHGVTAEESTSWPGTAPVDLDAGAIGSIVAVYSAETQDNQYEVEFVANDGSTTALLTLKESDLELMGK